MRRSGPIVCLTLVAFGGPASAQIAPVATSTDPASEGSDEAYADAAQRYGVPEPLLRALAEVESGGSTRNGVPTRDGRTGLLGLVPGMTLERASALTGFSADELVREPRASLLGGAAVLAETARGSRDLEDTLVAWAGDYDVPAASWDFAAHVITLLGPLDDYADLAAPRGAGFVPSGRGPPPFEVDTAARPDYPGARWVGPACSYTNASRGSGTINMVIIHTCEGGFSGCWSWLSGCHDVSAHYVVSTGGEVVQVVEDQDTAWHAGCVNGRSIGIEHEGSSLHPEGFTDAMYCASSQLVRWLCDRYGFPCDRSHVIGHGEANDLYCGGTHWDPGPGWDWGRFMDYVRCGCGGCCTPSAETCNGADDDCDGAVDEGLERGCGTDVGACETGIQTCAAGAWGVCRGAIEPVPETCNDVDDDCDGEVDDERVCEREEVGLQSAVLDAGGSTDVDGDGRADACARDDDAFRCHLASGRGFATLFLGPALSDAGGWADAAYGSTVRLGDIDGDGRADLCARDAAGVSCWRSAGIAFAERLRGPALSDADGWNDVTRYGTLRLADFDGDGRADLCARDADGFACRPSTGAGFGAAIRLAPLTDADGWNDVVRSGTIRMGDIDGDGRADLCARAAQGVRCWRSSAAGAGDAVAGPAWTDADGWDALDHWSTIRLADVNGDGRADLCARGDPDFRCHLSGDDGFGGAIPGPALPDADGWDARGRYGTIRMGDVDGDGSADLCARSARGIICWLWTGAGFGRQLIGPALSDDAGWNAPPYARTIRLADVNGDGLQDVCARGTDGLRCWVADGAGFPMALRGPDWTDADGWDDPANYATIRIGGGTRRNAAPETGTDPAGCGCSATGRSPGHAGLLVLLLGLVAVRRRLLLPRRLRYGSPAGEGRRRT